MTFFQVCKPRVDHVLSEYVDQHLRTLGYKNDYTRLGDQVMKSMAKSFTDGTYTVKVHVYRDHIFFHKEYYCGGEVARARYPIPADCVTNVGKFQQVLSTSFKQSRPMFE